MANYWDQSDQSGWFNQPTDQSNQNYNQWGYDEKQQQQQQQQGYDAYGYGNSNQQGGEYSSNNWNGNQQGFYQQNDGQISGASQQQQQYGGSMFIPSTQMPPQSKQNNQSNRFANDNVDFEDEPPLLEELGINFGHIRDKTLAVLNPLTTPDPKAVNDQDLAGPLVFALMFGGSLLLHGKVQFGIIYGIGVLGCVGMYFLLNMMSVGGISLTCTVSVLGYCLLPMAMLSALAAVLSFKGMLGLLVSLASVLWCSASSAKLFVTALDMKHQAILVAYPCAILYAMFALLAIF